MEALKTSNTISEWVSQNFRTADIFNRYGIDYCCGGNITLESACEKFGLNPTEILQELRALMHANATQINYNSWPISYLVDFIQFNCHSYVRTASPIISELLKKVAAHHGESQPYLIEMQELFEAATEDLLLHMEKEENLLFPVLKNDLDLVDEERRADINNLMELLMDDHSNEGARFERIRSLSNGFSLPESACNSFRVCMQQLKEFEGQLHFHVHLENNILFPKVKEFLNLKEQEKSDYVL
jgi:regulator of cell morphogenesis and NO signaling